MITVVYKVKIPIPDTADFKEVTLFTRQEVCEFLDISQTTFYSIINNKIKCKTTDTVHLHGISIEKTTADIDKPDVYVPPSDPVTIQKRNSYLNALIQKS